MWAGDAAGKDSDFLGVIDADPHSSTYGTIVASLPTGEAGSHPHHTEHEMPASGRLLANGFGAGKTWLFDLADPREPRLAALFADRAGFSHPHSFVRLPTGTLLATFQYAASGAPPSHAHISPPATTPARATGGLVELREDGEVIRSAEARDPSIHDSQIFPYAALPLPAIDRIVSTTTDMNAGNTAATSEWIQIWRLSDLTLLRSVPLPPGPRGDEHRFTGEPRLLADGRSVLVHTFNCGLYLLRGLDLPAPEISFVASFEGADCGVPVLAGQYWIQTVPQAHALVALDVSDPQHPREVSRLVLGEDEQPHWLAMDPTGRRLVVNSAGSGTGHRLFVVDFDPAAGTLTLDARFRAAGSPRPGLDLTVQPWPHGFRGTAVPHGTVFSR
jgi:hypothetical protein